MHKLLQEYADIIGTINIIALMAGLIGFVITIIQLKSSAKDSKKISNIGKSLEEQLNNFEKQNTELKMQNAELTLIKESLSTKYIGQFPDFISYTIDLLRSAQRKIEIVCDFPCYCYFSDYKKYIDYTNILREKEAANIDILLTCPDSVNRARLLSKQFRASNPNIDWKERPEIKEKLLEFLSREKINNNFESLTIDDFNQYIDKINLATLSTIFRHKYFEVDQQLPVYYWIVDDSKAVFSIPSFTEYDREQGFMTNDAKLISALKTINMELKRRA